MECSNVLALSYPAQGHVIVCLELSCLGFRVTFINSEFNHSRLVSAGLLSDDKIRLVSIPDGLEALGRQELERITAESGSGDCRITCMIADATMAWALEVAEKMKIPRTAAFWPMSAMTMVSGLSVEKLIAQGIIDESGGLLKRGVIHLRQDMPVTKAEHLSWTCMGDSATRKVLFDCINACNKIPERATWMICNSSAELEPGAFTCDPHIWPIGPLLASNGLDTSTGYFRHAEDEECLSWLDHHQPRSVIYAAASRSLTRPS